ncbi:MAG: DUF4845 domain-containing protein [Nevskia sp.]|nr:DUF4845 domain-containing protein [Nevskia sp.]
MWGLIFVLAVVGSVAYLLIVCVPVYLNEGTINRDLHEVATKAATTGGDIDPNDVKLDIQRRWDIDYVSRLDPKDIKVARGQRGWEISYNYEVREHLFYNVFLVLHFENSIPIVAKATTSVG